MHFISEMEFYPGSAVVIQTLNDSSHQKFSETWKRCDKRRLPKYGGVKKYQKILPNINCQSGREIPDLHLDPVAACSCSKPGDSTAVRELTVVRNLLSLIISNRHEKAEMPEYIMPAPVNALCIYTTRRSEKILICRSAQPVKFLIRSEKRKN